MMATPRYVSRVKEELNDLLHSMIELGIVDDQNFPFARQISNNRWEISFTGAGSISSVINYENYEELYSELHKNRLYNAKLVDGGLLQLMYQFDGESLIKHRLAFYSSPTLRSFQDIPQEYMEDKLYLEIVSRRLIPFPLRFDFDLNAARDVEHPQCHLTLGDAKGCRIPVSAPLTPRWFIEFILRNFYQTQNYYFVDNLPRHYFFFDATITDRERGLIHMVIPGGTQYPCRELKGNFYSV